jgi:5'-deoxynucleotidase YfbR-like HD superfamily hydrolase
MSIDRSDNIQLYFKKPEHEPTLSDPINLAIAMGALVSRLVLEERTRTIHPDGRRENVAEHALMLVKVAVYLAREFYPDLDAGKIAIKAAGHDDIEAYVLDTATDRITEEGRLDKERREAYGLQVLVDEYGEVSPSYVQDIAEYEGQESLEDEFVKLIDKWMVLLIHMPNEGATLREHYTYEEFVENTMDTDKRLRLKHPRFPELVDARTEFAMHLGNKYIRDWAE